MILQRPFDVSATFDTVNHDDLLERIVKSFGVGGRHLFCLHSDLQGNTQTVVFDSKRY